MNPELSNLINPGLSKSHWTMKLVVLNKIAKLLNLKPLVCYYRIKYIQKMIIEYCTCAEATQDLSEITLTTYDLYRIEIIIDWVVNQSKEQNANRGIKVNENLFEIITIYYYFMEIFNEVYFIDNLGDYLDIPGLSGTIIDNIGLFSKPYFNSI